MLEEDYETIEGFDIRKRPLTEEEANREVTLERFQEWHGEAGEDFVDYFSSIDAKIFGGWLMCKYPHLSLDILKVLNKGGGAQTLMHDIHTDIIGDDEDDENFGEGLTADDKFYKDLAEFTNLTSGLKKRINEQLILLMEYYQGGGDQGEDED